MCFTDETKYVEISNLVKKVQSRKKKGMTCRFRATWVPSDESRRVHFEENMDETKVKQSKKLINKVYSSIVTINDLSHITLSEILEKSGFTEEQYELECVKYRFL